MMIPEIIEYSKIVHQLWTEKVLDLTDVIIYMEEVNCAINDIREGYFEFYHFDDFFSTKIVFEEGGKIKVETNLEDL